MLDKILAIIGAGVMGEALLKGLISSQALNPESIIVSDTRESRRSELQKVYGVKVAESNQQAVKEADVIILAVKPAGIDEVLDEITSVVTNRQILISIAAGISTEHILSRIGKKIPLVRVMPNSCALVQQSTSVISVSAVASTEAKNLAAKIFSSLGEVIFLEEKYQNEATALSGSGPAYFYLFAEALIDAGVKAGLARNISSKLVVGTLVGAGKMLKETGKHPALLRDMVASPGGTTMAAVEAFEKAGFRAGVFQAVEAAIERARELG